MWITIAIILSLGFIYCGIYLTFYLLTGFQFFTKFLKKLNPNKKQILFKSLLYGAIEENQAIKEVFTEDDINLFNAKKLQKIRKQKLNKINSL